jgi:DNA-binding transcriptional LysR family regulator
MKDLEGETLLLPNRESCPGMYDKTLELYAEAGISPNIVHVPLNPSPNSDSQIVMVACGKGILIMPDEMSRRPAPGSEVIAVQLGEPNAKIDVHMAWRKNEVSTVVLAFLGSARRVFRVAEKRSIPRGFVPHGRTRLGNVPA